MLSNDTKPDFSFGRQCFFCLLSWLAGIGLSIILFINSPTRIASNKQMEKTDFAGNKQLASATYLQRTASIFFHNGKVGIIICVCGFITAGLISFLMLAYNGFMVASIVINAMRLHYPLSYFIRNLFWHGIFEMTALIWFGAIGLSGFFAYKILVDNKSVTLSHYISLKKIVIPFLLLAIGALIESL